MSNSVKVMSENFAKVWHITAHICQEKLAVLSDLTGDN